MVMVCRRRLILISVLPLLCLLGMAGCAARAAGGGAVVPPWRLIWVSPPAGMSAGIPVEVAFARGARLLHYSAELPLDPSATSWLVTSPTFGIALVELDPAAQYEDLVVMNTAPGQTWVESAGTVRGGTDCTDGHTTFGGLVFPQPVCTTGTGYKRTTQSQPWESAVTSWYSTSQTYVLGHLSGLPQHPPAGAEDMQMNGHAGWQTQTQRITAAVVPLPGNETFVFACKADATHCSTLAAQALGHLNSLAALP